METDESLCADEMVETLLKHFGGHPAPPFESIIGVGSINDRHWITWQFKGKRWEEVKFWPHEFYELLGYTLSESGFRYYLPALLRSTLEHRSWQLAQRVATNFRLGEGQYREDYMATQLALLEPLSRGQRSVMESVFRCIAQFADFDQPEDEPEWPETPEERKAFSRALGMSVEHLPATYYPVSDAREDDRTSLLIVADALSRGPA